MAKTLRETMREMLDSTIPGSNITYGEKLVMVMIRKALDGDVRAATFIRDTIGEMPRQGVDVTSSDGTLRPAMTNEERALKFAAMLGALRERDEQGAAA